MGYGGNRNGGFNDSRMFQNTQQSNTGGYRSYQGGQSNNYRSNPNVPSYGENNNMHHFFDMYSKDCDNLYREPKDGMISLKKNYENNPIKPEIELVTLIDLSTLFDEKQKLAGKIAE